MKLRLRNIWKKGKAKNKKGKEKEEGDKKVNQVCYGIVFWMKVNSNKKQTVRIQS